MENILDFSKGLNLDNSEINQPKSTYRYMLNGVNISEQGDIFNISNERGTTSKVNNFPIGFKIIGGCVLNTDFICFLVDPINNYSQVGIINSDFSYLRKVPSTDASNELGLRIDRQISCVARKLFTGDRIVYFVDNNVNLSFLNLDNPPLDTDLAGSSRIVPNQSLPIIDLSEIKENTSGNLRPGVYQVVTRYRTTSLNPTTFSIPSNPVPVVPHTRAEGRNNYDGEYYDYGNISKTLIFNVFNVDTSYPYLEVVVIYYDNSTNSFTAKALPLINITGNTVQFSFNNTESNTTSLTQAEIQTLPISYSTAKCINQKDDRLLISNLRESNSVYDQELQNIANNITVRYKIEEIEYLDGTSASTTPTFEVDQDPYFIGSDNKVYIKFTDKLDPTTATDLTKYTLKDGGGATSSPTDAVIDSTDATQVILTFAATPIDSTYTIKIDTINNYSITQNYSTSSSYIAISFGSPFEVTGNIPSTSSFNDYKNEYLTFTKKGYMRNEVYSFGIGVIFKDGTVSFVYHIPSTNFTYNNDPTDPLAINAIPDGVYGGDTGGQLGVYISDIAYPLNQSYPSGNIRHHKMPTTKQEPHFRYDSGTGKTYIRPLGIEFKINTALSTQLQGAIQGIVFFRQRRNTEGNRSVLTQGLITRFVEVGNTYKYSDGTVDDVTNNTFKKIPFFGNSFFQQVPIVVDGHTTASAGLYYDNIQNDRMAFFSPEILFGTLSASEIQGASLSVILGLTGRLDYNYFYRSRNRVIDKSAAASGVILGYNTLGENGKLYLYSNYYKESIVNNSTFVINTSQFVPKGNIVTIDDKKIDSTTSEDFLYIKTGSALNNTDLGITNSITYSIQSHDPEWGDGLIPKSEYKVDNNDNWGASGSDITNNLFSIVKNNRAQYGVLNSSEFIPIAQINTIPNNVPFVYPVTYGGDTFISKFAFTNKDLYAYRGLIVKRESVLGVSVYQRNYTNADIDIPIFPGTGYAGADLRAVSYYFVESTINTNYRHQFVSRPANTLGPKYYPKYPIGEVLFESPLNGDSNSYNTQYSFENTVKFFYTKNLSYDPNKTGNYENRTIYSELAHQDEVTDNFRIFLQDNYHDIPKHTGPIWNTFIHNNTLYLHTTKSLWRSYFNDISETINDLGTVILGSGGIFNLPSREIFTASGGYAGTISQFGGTHTPFGYIFPDALQNKIFMLSDSLQEISQEGLMQFFNQNLGNNLVVNSEYIDNPANPNSAGIIGVYDYALKRYIITKRGTSSDLTLSYSLLNRCWTSFHSYKPHYLTAINSRLFGFTNDTTTLEMHEHNVGERGIYYGLPVQPLVFEFISNNDIVATKAHDNLYIRTHSEDDNGNYLDLETFKSIQCSNEKQDTGVVNLICTNLFNDNSNVKKKRDQFQIQIPRNSIGVDPLYPDRMKGKYLKVRLVYPNTNNYKLLLNYIITIDRPVAR